MARFKLSTILCVVVTMLTVISFGSFAHAKDIELKFANFLPPAMKVSSTCETLGKMITEFTDGKVKVTMFHAGSLGKATDHLKMLNGGVCDIALIATPFHGDTFEMFLFADLPMLGIPNEFVFDNINWELYYKGKYFRGINEYKLLGLISTPPILLFSKKKVTKIEDLAGLKIRVPTVPISDFLSSVGATPVSIASSEVYMALDRGIVDGATSGYDMILGRKWYESTKYCIWNPSLTTGAELPILMSKKAWGNLPSDTQAGIERAISAFRFENQRSYFDTEKTPIDQLKEAGVDVYELGPVETEKYYKLAVPIKDKWIKDKEAKGLPARELLEDVNKIISRYK